MLKTIFFGTPLFVEPLLKILLQDTNLLAVVTMPGNNFVSKFAQHYGLELFQPTKFDNLTLKKLAKLTPDYFVTLAYGKILPQKLLNIPAIAPLNIHFSLLPLYRGATPVQSTLLSGEKVTGSTIQIMDAGMDTGNIIWQKELKIASADNTEGLLNRLVTITKPSLIKVLVNLSNQKITPRRQDHAQATYCSKSDFHKNKALITWDLPREVIHNKIRALYPEPIAYTIFTDKKKKLLVNLLASSLETPPSNYLTLVPGQVVIFGKQLFIKTQDSFLRLDLLQPQGKRKQSGAEFINGYRRFLDL